MTARTRWLLYAALAVLPLVGALAGMAYAGGKPPVYTAEARLAMGRGDAVDDAAQAQAASLSRFLSSTEALSKLPAGRVLSVSAGPIPQSSVIRVEAKALDQANAVEAARVGAEMLQTKVAAATGRKKAAETLAQLRRLNRQVATFQSRVNASGGSGSDFVEAQTQLSSVTAQRDATTQIYQERAKAAANTDLTMLAAAGPTGDNAASRKQIALLAGFGGGALLAYVIARVVGDLRRRPQSAPAPSRPPAHATPVHATPARGAPARVEERRVLDLPEERPDVLLPEEPELDADTRLLAPVVPEQGTAPKPERRGPTFLGRAKRPERSAFPEPFPPLTVPGPEAEPEPATGPVPQVRPAAGAGARRGLNGLRQEAPTPRRDWP